jgi:hypothetical protein
VPKRLTPIPYPSYPLGLSLPADRLAAPLPLLEEEKNGIMYTAAGSNQFTHFKFICMPKKTAHPKKNKPTQKKSSAQKKAYARRKVR